MSYPVKRCPWCGYELEDPTTPTVDTAIEREREIWRPLDCILPEINLPSVWIEAETDSTDSITTTDGRGTWTVINA